MAFATSTALMTMAALQGTKMVADNQVRQDAKGEAGKIEREQLAQEKELKLKKEKDKKGLEDTKARDSARRLQKKGFNRGRESTILTDFETQQKKSSIGQTSILGG